MTGVQTCALPIYPDHYENIKFDNIKSKDLLQKGTELPENKGAGRGSVARLYSYWEDDLNVQMVYDNKGERIILAKKKNPYFEYRDPLIQANEWAKETNPEAYQAAEMSGIPIKESLPEILPEIKEFEPIVNFLSEPRKPFVQFPSMKLMGKMYSNNIMNQAKETLINYIGKKRQVADNLRGCNIKIVVDSNSFNEEERAAINDEPLQVLYADMQTNPNPVQILAPTFPELSGV